MSVRKPTARGQLVLDEIVEAATSVFAAKGFTKATLENVADRLKVSRATLYYYVRSKEDLLRRVISNFVGVHLEELAELHQQRDLAPDDQLRQVMRLQVRQLGTHPDVVRVFLREEGELPPDLLAEQRVYRRRIQEAVEEMVAEGTAAGLFRDMDPQLVTFALFGMVNWMHVWFDPEGRYSTEEIADVFADLILLGLIRRDRPAASGSLEVTIGEMSRLVERFSGQVAQLRQDHRPTPSAPQTPRRDAAPQDGATP